MLQAFKRRLKNKKGFTLIELIVVIAIIGILATVLIPRFTGFTDDAKTNAAKADAKNIILAIETIHSKDSTTALTEANIKTITGPLKGTITGTITYGTGDYDFTYTLNSKTVTVTDGQVVD